MALSDELEKLVSERYALIKITPALRLNTLLSVFSGNTYLSYLTNRFEISSVKVDGVAYAEDTSSSPAASKYYYNVDSGLFKIQFSAAFTTQEAVLFFNLRFTDSEYSVFSEAGVKNGVSAYSWNCRIHSAPEFDVSVRDFLAGVPSISSSRFTVLNDDGWMSSYIGSEYSYFNKDCKVWLCINQVVSATFLGKLRDVSPSGSDYSFEIYDNSYKLKEPCLMGDTNEESYYNQTTYPTADPAAMGDVIPFVIGRSTFRTVKYTDFVLTERYNFIPEKTQHATCLTTSTSLTWAVLRTGVQNPKQASYGTTTSVAYTANVYAYGNAGAGNRAQLIVTNNASFPHNLEILDAVEFKKAGVYYKGTVVRIFDNDVYHVMMHGTTAAAGTYTVTDSPQSAIGVMIVQGSYSFYPVNDTDFVLGGFTLSNGDVLWKLTFVAGFESNHPGMNAIDYLNTQIYFRWTEDISGTVETTHGNAVKRILQGAGLTVNSASITAADAALSAKVAMMIPEFGSTKPGPYTDYLGLLMQSTLGYFYQDNSTLEIKYKLFEAPAAGTLILSNEILDISVEFNGSDMAQSIRAYNDGNYYATTDFTSTPPFVISKSLPSVRAKYQHELTNQISVQTALAVPSYTASRRGPVSENIQMFVTFSTATKGSNLNIGDDVSIYDDRIPGTKATVSGYSCSNLKILGIKYSSDKITFTCFDYKVA